MSEFERLFQPGRIGKLELKNRLVLAAMGTSYNGENGYVSQRLIDYFEARARGGAGLVTLGITAISATAKLGKNQLTIADDSYIPGLKELAKAVHRHGAKIAVQLHHGGRQIMQAVTGYPPVAPSPIPTFTGETPHELTAAEIKEITGQFVAGVRRAKEAGLDAVEVHGAHQYLLSSFLSAATNTREDNYGGSLENRGRFLVEVLEAIREAVGADFPVWPRLSGQEYGMNDGITIEETKQIIPILVKAGAQAIHVSAYGLGRYLMKAPSPDTAGFLLPLAAEVKKVSPVPVIAVGRLDAKMAEQALREGKTDFAALGRRLMADPELPNKLARGQAGDVNPCIGCLECLERYLFARTDTACTVNAAMGREAEYTITPAKQKKRVVVIGGGPAGMETARVAALRGHKVTLFEKGSVLGGQLNVAAVPPFKGDILPQIEYHRRQLEKLGVDVKLGTEATTEIIRQGQPEAVVIATGSAPVKPDIPGTDRANVFMAADVLEGNTHVGQKVVIIGGGMVGCETGHFLLEQGKDVTIIEATKRLASDMFPMVRRRLIDALRADKATMLTLVNCEAITDEGVNMTNTEGQQEAIPADTVVLAVGYQSNNSLHQELDGLVPELHCIGDASKPQRIMEAINDGYRTGLAL